MNVAAGQAQLHWQPAARQGHVYGRETRELVEELAARLALAERKLTALPNYGRDGIPD